eukprot:TRINITY_DN11702_c0_g2_i1.p2 TRINITY_DN11702_c0_g2~~TRINITY_DN11702_c0_g2_i1.p2  ORF type:complete len:100 (+),score=15.90 TRINITY_DN11702_c0_g2_i1:669-968(+)
MIRDLLYAEQHREKNILFLGRPSTGKTTVIRDVAQMLSVEREQNVVIIDTSNEIAGDGIQTHPSVGMARRMMVKKPSDQFNTMLECVQVSFALCADFAI